MTARVARLVLWEGGGNVPPFLVLADRLQAAGWTVDVDVVHPFGGGGASSGDGPEPDVAVVDCMLVEDMCRSIAAGTVTVPLVHTLLRANLDADGEQPHYAMAAPLGTVNDLRSTLGLGPVARLVDVLWTCPAALVTTVPALDAGPPVPDAARYVGPLLQGAGPDADWTPPAGEGPLVAVNLGTTDMGEGDALRQVLDALRALPVRIVATVGDHLDPEEFGPEVSGLVRHAALLPHADVVVSHAGLGSVSAALAHGLPLVCLPLGREQPTNAAAVARLGAGVTTAPGTVADAVEHVLGDPAFAAADALVPS